MDICLKKIPNTYRELLSDFAALLKERFGDDILSAVLYGSVARGTARKESDIDLCLIFRSLPASRHKRTLLIFPLIKELREMESYKALYGDGYLPEISPLLYTIEEMQNTKPVFLDMVGEGIALLDNDGTWKRKRNALQRRMRALGTRKVNLKNDDYYWVLKPGLHLNEEVTL